MLQCNKKPRYNRKQRLRARDKRAGAEKFLASGVFRPRRQPIRKRPPDLGLGAGAYHHADMAEPGNQGLGPGQRLGQRPRRGRRHDPILGRDHAQAGPGEAARIDDLPGDAPGAARACRSALSS